MNCDGCEREIAEGQHHMVVDIRLATRMPPDFVPVREVEPTEFKDLKFHNPACHLMWYQNQPIIQNVFGC